MTLCNLQIHWLYIFFPFLLCSTACFSLLVKTRQWMCQNDPPNKCAKMTRQNILPWKSAGFTRENNPPNLLARDPPFPAQDPPGRTWLASLLPPPPHGSANGAGGGGREPARPTHAYWTGTFPFFPHLMNGYIFLYNTTYTYSTQSGLIWKYKCITVGEGIIARKGWGASLLPAPLQGVFCINVLLQEVSRLAILTRIGYENIYNIPLYSNEYTSA